MRSGPLLGKAFVAMFVKSNGKGVGDLLKQKTWANSKKMRLDSDYAEFNRQSDVITTGNVYSSTQKSRHIRPWSMDTWGGKTYEKGRLMEADMNGFKPIGSDVITNAIYDEHRDSDVILYEFFLKKYGKEKGKGVKDVIGHVLTDDKNKLIGYILYVPERNAIAKRRSALYECMNYIADGWNEMSDMERIMWKPSYRKAAVNAGSGA